MASLPVQKPNALPTLLRIFTTFGCVDRRQHERDVMNSAAGMWSR